MLEQRILGVITIAAALGAGIGCDDEKKPAAADPLKALTEPAAAESAETPALKPELPPTPAVNEMVLIPGGTFTMGSTQGQKDEKPPKRVKVRAFEMDIHEVTLRSYIACINTRHCSYPDYDSYCNWGKKHRYDDPMNCVAHDQAEAYCKSVGKRLPTEAEWEYAARGTDGREYGWGEGDPPEDICFNRGKRGTCRVDKVPIDSPFKLRGMAGNVWEWTADGYSENYSKPRKKDRMVYRGGGFLDEEVEDLRAAARNMRPPYARMDYIGFRCARTPGAKKK